MDKAEIVLYKDTQNTDFQIEVRVEDETVWLNRQQMALLFDRDIKTIGKHINNALKEELKSFPVIAKFATTASDGKTYQVDHYNLDVIISVGYRVKSDRGIQFRMWANKVLKEYLLNGYSVNSRMNRIESNLDSLARKVDDIDLQLHSDLTPKQGVFYDGQVFDAYQFVSDIVRSAKSQIILIDNYIDDTVLTLLSKKSKQVECQILTKSVNKRLVLDAHKFNEQYGLLHVKVFEKSHDRFIIIDNEVVFHLGASLKDLGKKWFAFSKLEKSSLSFIREIEKIK